MVKNVVLLLLLMQLFFRPVFLGDRVEFDDDDVSWEDQEDEEEEDEVSERDRIAREAFDFQEAHTFRFHIGGLLYCTKNFRCDPDAELSLIVSVIGYWHAGTRKKIVTFSYGLDGLSGSGWYFRQNEEQWKENGKVFLAPLAWTYGAEISFPKENGVAVVNVQPRNKPSFEAEVKLEQEMKSGQNMKMSNTLELSLEGGPTASFNANFDYESVKQQTTTNHYGVYMREYNTIAGGTSNRAFAEISRQHIRHNFFVKPLDNCNKGFDSQRMSPLSFSGFIPMFIATVEGEKNFTKRQVVNFKVYCKLAKLSVTFDGCNKESPKFRYHDELIEKYEFNKKVTIWWGHPIFMLMQPILMKLHNSVYPTDKHCMEAISDSTLSTKLVFLTSCKKFDNIDLHAWTPDEYDRLHWFSKKLDQDYCLSSDIELFNNLFIEPCSKRLQQKWMFNPDDGFWKNIEGYVSVNREAHAPIMVRYKEDLYPNLIWVRKPAPKPLVYQAFEAN